MLEIAPYLTFFALLMLVVIVTALGVLERKVDRILKHLGLADEDEPPRRLFSRLGAAKKTPPDEL